MVEIEGKIQFLSCPNCGKGIRVESPEQFRTPKKVELVIGSQRAPMAHRKTDSFCAHCLKTMSVLWFF